MSNSDSIEGATGTDTFRISGETSNASRSDGSGSSDNAGTDGPSKEALRAELELLRERNRRLQEQYTLAKQSKYHQTATALAVLGTVALGGAALFPDVRTVLIALGAIGLFAGVLTYYLTPEQFVSADVGHAVYRSMAEDRAELVAELGLSDSRIYVPTESGPSRVRLFVPQHSEFVVPEDAELDSTLIVPPVEAGRGAAFMPTGESLYEAFREALPDELDGSPAAVAAQLSDALVEQFELLQYASADVDPEDRRLMVSVGESVYGPVAEFDHPVASFYAVGLARALDEPISAEVAEVDDDRAEYLLTYRWGHADDLGPDSR